MQKILVANRTFPAAGLQLLREHVNADVVISKYSDDAMGSKEELQNLIVGTKAIIWNTKYHLTKEFLDLAGPQLKYVSTMSSGLDHMDLQELKKRGIALGNTPSVLNAAVADIAVGLLISSARRFKEGVMELERGEWKYGVTMLLGRDIADSVVGIMGFGGLGQAILKRLKGFEVKKFIYSGHREKPEGKALGAEFVSSDTLLRESDFIILSCPLTEETRHFINAETINKMKETATIINISRGEVVDQDALVNALKSNRIWAAGLDVVTPEPISPDHPLVHLPNCFVIPHLGSATFETRNKMSVISAENIIRSLKGEPMLSPVL